MPSTRLRQTHQLSPTKCPTVRKRKRVRRAGTSTWSNIRLVHVGSAPGPGGNGLDSDHDSAANGAQGEAENGKEPRLAPEVSAGSGWASGSEDAAGRRWSGVQRPERDEDKAPASAQEAQGSRPQLEQGLIITHASATGLPSMLEILRRSGSGIPYLVCASGEKRLIVPPVARPLRRVVLIQQRDFASPQLGRDWHVAIGSPEVAVPLRDLVMEDEGISPDRRRHRAQQPMVLMGVVHSGRQNHVGSGTSAAKACKRSLTSFQCAGSRPS